MSNGWPQLTRAAHDLNNVATLVINGWVDGAYKIVSTNEMWVEIETLQRHPGEFWTFARQKDGTLNCRSSLVGSSSPPSTDGLVMTIRVPKARIDNLEIKFAPAHSRS